MKKIIKYFFIALSIVIILVWILCVINSNRNAKQEKDIVGVGETIESAYGTCCITDVKIYDLPSFIPLYDNILWESDMFSDYLFMHEKGDDIYILLYNMHCSFTYTNYDDMIEMYPKKLISYDNSLMETVDIALSTVLNEDTCIDGNNELDVLVPVMVRKEDMTKKQWENFQQEECGFYVLVQSNPIERKIALDKTEHIKASKEQLESFDELVKKAHEAQDKRIELREKVYEDNIFDRKGKYDCVNISLDTVKEIKRDEFVNYKQENFFENITDDFIQDNWGEKYFEVKVTLENDSDDEIIFDWINTGLACAEGTKVCMGSEILYLSNVQYDGTSAAKYRLMPHEKTDFTIIYMDIWADGSTHDFWYNNEIYFRVGNNLTTCHSLNDKQGIFIKGVLE